MDRASNRILIVDDNPAIHEDLREVLCPNKLTVIDKETTALEKELFSDDEDKASFEPYFPNYIMDDAFQGDEAIAMVEKAERERDPYSLIFMDVRMPPGIDGIQTIHEIWKKYPDIEIIICTAFSDYSWDQILEKLGSTDNLLFMKKPFDAMGVRQMALSITKKRAMARQSKSGIKILKDEINSRSRELNKMISNLEALKTKAESATISKEGCLSSISHGIQKPLSGILGIADMLLDTELNADQRDLANTIKVAGDSLLTAVDDVLQYPGTEAGGFVLENIEFNIRTALENTADLVSANAHEKGLESATLIHADIPETLIGDPLRLRRILLILASNAVESTDTGEIVLSVQRDLTAPSHEDPDLINGSIGLRFEVSDTGTGLSDEKRQHLNKLLSDPETILKNGTGLSFCKNLVEMMNGKMGLESDEGMGSTLWFTARFGTTDAPNYQILPTAATMSGARCLLVGDNPTSRKVLSLYINQWGGNCSEAMNGISAVEQLHTALPTKPFDAVIVDIKNGDKTRYKEIANSIRRHKTLDDLQLICLTPKSKRGDAKELKKYGYCAYLSKPIRHSHLYNSLLMIKGFRNNSIAVKDDQIITKHFFDEISADRYRFLVVEDNPVNTNTLVRMLNRMTISCDVARNGKEAISACSKRKYDMILMDCHMPEMDGYEATREIRKIEQDWITDPRKREDKTRVPILALTAYADAENRDKCFAAGMDAFLTKPIKADQMANILREHLKHM